MKKRSEIAKHISSLCSSLWVRHYISSKIKTDPLYEGVYLELKDSKRPLMDIGSGMAILAFYLREKDWSNPVTAIDYDERKIEAGNLLIQKGGYQGITLERGDARESLPTHQGDVTILDILQFFQKTDQIKLLELAAENVAPGAKLLIRSGIKERNFRFFITWVVDVFAKCSFWMKAAPTYYPTKETFEGVFGKEGFDLEIRPFWGNTPFNNYLVVIKKLK